MSVLSQEDSNSQFGTVRGALFSSQFSCADEEKSQTQGLNTFSIDSNSSNNDGDFKIARALFDSQNTSFFSSSQVNDSQPLLSTSISSGTNKYITPSKHPTDFSQVCCFCCSLLISPSEQVSFNSHDIIDETPVLEKSSRSFSQSINFPKHHNNSLSGISNKVRSKLFNAKKEMYICQSRGQLNAIEPLSSLISQRIDPKSENSIKSQLQNLQIFDLVTILRSLVYFDDISLFKSRFLVLESTVASISVSTTLIIAIMLSK